MDVSKVTQGSVWKHYKNGKPYIVFCVAINVNFPEEEIIVYREVKPVNPDPFYWRTTEEFLEKFKPVTKG